MRILAVDDDPIILQLLTGCLTEENDYFLTCCDSAEAALDIVRDTKNPFDCFLLDIMLPGVDGVELCGNLRAISTYASTPILMITGSREVGLMKRVFLAGATDFISKPLNGIELGARINTAGMLNASLLREEQTRHTLDELSQAMSISFEEPVLLKIEGISELLALENELLRLGAGCYAIDLFSIQVDQLRGIHRTVKAPEFRNCLEQIARASVASLAHTTNRLAYAGRGRFIGFVMGRSRVKIDDIAAEMNTSLAQSWQSDTSGLPVAPELLVKPLSDKRLWSAASASESIRQNTMEQEPFVTVSPDDESSLFSKLDAVLSSKG